MVLDKATAFVKSKLQHCLIYCNCIIVVSGEAWKHPGWPTTPLLIFFSWFKCIWVWLWGLIPPPTPRFLSKWPSPEKKKENGKKRGKVGQNEEVVSTFKMNWFNCRRNLAIASRAIHPSKARWCPRNRLLLHEDDNWLAIGAHSEYISDSFICEGLRPGVCTHQREIKMLRSSLGY